MCELDSNLKVSITDKIQTILNKQFKNEPAKRKIKSNPKYLQFACPICGDSAKDFNKKRGMLYWNDLYFHCFNCGEHMSLNSLLKFYDMSYEGADKITITNYINDNHVLNVNTGAMDFYLFEKIEKLAIPFEQFSVYFNAERINEHTYRAYPYLKSRLLHKKLNEFAYNKRTCELYILNFARNGNIIGFQIRNLKAGKTRYLTYTLERMYERMGLEIPEIDGEKITEDEMLSLNKISSIFGILNVNLANDFTIFEGPIDSFFMKNSIGICGVKKKVADFESLPTARYFFDNDSAGKTTMIDKLKGGARVFMWEKFCNDYHISAKKVKDLNDLIKYEYVKKTGCLKELNNYFTNNHLDIMYV